MWISSAASGNSAATGAAAGGAAAVTKPLLLSSSEDLDIRGPRHRAWEKVLRPHPDPRIAGIATTRSADREATKMTTRAPRWPQRPPARWGRGGGGEIGYAICAPLATAA